jgi:hypothetical protein
MSTFGPIPFTEMANAFFSFDAYTKLWIGLAQNIPAELSGNMKGIREFLMTSGNPACDEITFTGQITIYRGVPAKDERSGAAYIPMSVVGMDEVGYAKSINTTIRVTADFSKPNFGYTHQMAAASLEIPAEARMLMTLRFSGIGGNLAEQLNTSDATVTKQIAATINSFPFTNGAAIFQHVGDAARPIVSKQGSPIGYLAHGIMIPQYSIGAPIPADAKTASRYQLGRIPTIPEISSAEHDFLMRRTSVVA